MQSFIKRNPDEVNLVEPKETEPKETEPKKTEPKKTKSYHLLPLFNTF